MNSRQPDWLAQMVKALADPTHVRSCVLELELCIILESIKASVQVLYLFVHHDQCSNRSKKLMVSELTAGVFGMVSIIIFLIAWSQCKAVMIFRFFSLYDLEGKRLHITAN